jgi:Raf kinase inhibitor-like YbhB/YbcL family protein
MALTEEVVVKGSWVWILVRCARSLANSWARAEAPEHAAGTIEDFAREQRGRRIPRAVLVPGMLALGIWVLSFAISLTGGSVSAAPQGQTARPFTLTSPDFRSGGPLPLRSAENQFGCHGRNIAPTLRWTGVPSGTLRFALAVTDYDAPVAGGFHHWIVYNIPGNVDTLNGTSPYPHTQGLNSYGFDGYGGPCPPATGQIHHYIFTLYALTSAKDLDPGLNYDQLIQAISNSVGGATVTIGTFVRG